VRGLYWQQRVETAERQFVLPDMLQGQVQQRRQQSAASREPPPLLRPVIARELEAGAQAAILLPKRAVEAAGWDRLF
jgi:hypothetical protein